MDYQWLIGSVVIPLIAAAATVFAVIVAYRALIESHKQLLEAQRFSKQQALEDRQHQIRPIVVPVGELLHHNPAGGVDWNDLYDLTTEELQVRIEEAKRQNTSSAPLQVPAREPNTQKLTLQNMGEGAAFNIHSFLYGLQHGPENQYTSWNNGPIQSNGSIEVLFTHGATMLFEDTIIDGIHKLYDDSDPYYRVARLTTTYHDLFGIKHVSIFDYISQGNQRHKWLHVATETMIALDLDEVDNQKQPAPVQRKLVR